MAKICSVVIYYIALQYFLLSALVTANQESQPTSGIAFDEIIVESSLTVKGKTGSSRQTKSKTLETVPSGESETKLERGKRQLFSAFTNKFKIPSASSAQSSSQSFSLGDLSSSSSQSNSNSFGAGTNGLSAASAHSFNRHFTLPGGFAADLALSNNIALNSDGPKKDFTSSFIITTPNGNKIQII